PITGKEITVTHSLRTMELVTESKIKPQLQQGARNAVIEKYSVRTAANVINWAGMGLSLTGNGSESDVESVKLYRKDSFGAVTLDVDGGVQTVLVSSTVMASGAASLKFASAETVNEVTRDYYLTYDLSNIAKVGATLGASGADSDFDLGADSVDKTWLPYSSALGVIIPTIDTMTVTAVDLMPAQIKQGSKTRAMAKLRLQTLTNGAVARSIKVKKIGSLADSAVSAIKIYRADPTGAEWVDIGAGATAAVRLVSSGTDVFVKGEASLSLLNSEVVDTAGKDFYLMAELSEESIVNETVGLRIEPAAISVDEPDLVSNTGLPFETKLAAIADNPDTLTISSTDLVGGGKSVIQGREHAVLKLAVTVNQDSVELNKIKIKKLGNCQDSDIEKIKIVSDENGNGSYDTGDLLLSGGSDQFVNGEIKIVLNKPEKVSRGVTKTYFVVLGINLNAEVGKDIGVEISDLSGLEVAVPDKVENSNFPLLSTIVTIKDGKTPTTPLIIDDGVYTANQASLHARWTAEVYSGTIGESLYAIGTTSATTDVAGWTSLVNSLEATRQGLILQNGITYYFSVKVRNSLGDYWSDTGISDGITVDIVKPQLKEKPKIIEVVKKGQLNDVNIKLPAAESGVSGITQYEIQQRETKSPVWKTIKIVIMAASAGKYSADSSLGYLVEGVLSGTYQYRVRVQNGAGVTSEWAEMESPVIVGELPAELLTAVSNYPNPFDSRETSTKINFTLNQAAHLKITIYDLLGYLVREISTEGNPGSNNNISWDGTDEDGRKVAQGMYLAVIEAKGMDGTKTKMVRRIGVVR
ncbi:MAG: FlgD immunoglobulin-like domain containing protein, partial [Elusimicrobiota bacterium]